MEQREVTLRSDQTLDYSARVDFEHGLLSEDFRPAMSTVRAANWCSPSLSMIGEPAPLYAEKLRTPLYVDGLEIL